MTGKNKQTKKQPTTNRQDKTRQISKQKQEKNRQFQESFDCLNTAILSMF